MRTPVCHSLVEEMATLLGLETLCLFPAMWDTALKGRQSWSVLVVDEECGALLYPDVLVCINQTVTFLLRFFVFLIDLVTFAGFIFGQLKSYSEV